MSQAELISGFGDISIVLLNSHLYSRLFNLFQVERICAYFGVIFLLLQEEEVFFFECVLVIHDYGSFHSML